MVTSATSICRCIRQRPTGVLGRVAIVMAMALFVIGCGDGGSPTAPTPVTAATVVPTPTIQSITVTLPAILIVGTAEQAGISAILSNGAITAPSGSWSSDNASVATVDATGRVTPLSNGRTTIRLVSGVVSGVRGIRVVPSYQGRWSGQIQVVGCSQTGFYAQTRMCVNYPTGRFFHTMMTLTQTTRDVVSGVFALGDLQSSTFNTPIETDGAITFTAPIVIPPTGDIFISGAWRVNTLTQGVMVGGVNQLWFNIGEFAGTGEMRIAAELRNMARQ